MPERTILHVDMDAFFASVEERDDPALLGRPLIVGGLGRRGVVATASYAARKFGVRSAMPTARARQLCPAGVFLAPRMARYAEVSRQVFAIFGRFTPLIEGLSLDEAFLDVGASLRLFGAPADIARAIQCQVRAETGLGCSVGIASNKWLAKLGSELGKPGGRFEISAANCQQVLDPLPVGRLWTVGKVTMEKLERAGFRRIADVRSADPRALVRVVGRQQALLQELARGIDHRPLVVARAEQSISAETTFEQDIEQLPSARTWLLALCERVGERTRRARLRGRVVMLKLRKPPFVTLIRQTTLDQAIDGTEALYRVADALLATWWQSESSPRLRLLGVALADFADAAVADDLFGAAPGQESDRVVDSLNRRFGGGTVRRARGLKPPGAVQRTGATEPPFMA